MADQTPGPIALALKLPFATPEEFLAKYGANLTRGGIFLRSKSVRAPGTPMALSLRLAGGGPLLTGLAVVHFVTGQQGSGLSGMGLKFLQLDEASQALVETAAASLPHAASDSPPVPPGVGPPQYAEEPLEASDPPPVPPVVHTPRHSYNPIATPVGTPIVDPLGAVGPVPPAPPFEEPKEAPAKTGPIIGIDLGTTNSCAAFVRNDKPVVLSSREGHNTVPSIIALNARGKLVVGHPAKAQMLTNPRQTVYGAKRLIGRAFGSPLVQLLKDRFHYEVAAGPEGESAVKLGDRVFSLQQICAMILREVREVAQAQIGQPVSRAVITVPAYYNDNQRQAVREAGRLAGLHVERILNEPTAAALAYGHGRKLTQRVLVYDLGGGTFDASLLELTENVYEVISTGGDTFLGGIDFDNAIVEFLLADFESKTGQPFFRDRVAMQRITDAAERSKCALSERNEVRVYVPYVALIDDKPRDLDVTLTRAKLIELTANLVDRTLKVCAEVLAARSVKPTEVDEVILVGGQSRFPLVHEKITAYFQKNPSKSVHPDEAVALGAALLGRSLGQIDSAVVLIDVLPMAIGVGLPGGRFKAVLERNTALPAQRKVTIGTSRDDQAELDLTIFQGESPAAQENEYLGTLKLSGLPQGPHGTVKVSITFEVSNECLLKVTAQELSTGREVSTVLTTHDTPDAVKARIANPDPGAGAGPARPAASAPAAAAAAAPAVQRPPAAAASQPPPVVPEPAPQSPAEEDEASPGVFGRIKRLFGN